MGSCTQFQFRVDFLSALALRNTCRADKYLSSDIRAERRKARESSYQVPIVTVHRTRVTFVQAQIVW